MSTTQAPTDAMTADECKGVQWKRLWAFFAAAMVLTHTGMAVYLAFGGTTSTAAAQGFGAVFMRACPGIVALLFQRFVVREPMRAALGIRFGPNRWFVVAWLVPAI